MCFYLWLPTHPSDYCNCSFWQAAGPDFAVSVCSTFSNPLFVFYVFPHLNHLKLYRSLPLTYSLKGMPEALSWVADLFKQSVLLCCVCFFPWIPLCLSTCNTEAQLNSSSSTILRWQRQIHQKRWRVFEWNGFIYFPFVYLSEFKETADLRIEVNFYKTYYSIVTEIRKYQIPWKNQMEYISQNLIKLGLEGILSLLILNQFLIINIRGCF